LVLDSGVLVQDGSHQELVTQSGIYAEMFKSWEASHQTSE
jgi:ABC-type multidrug transport system fused ATPase/permease subunit